ncbi:helix-turn-helix transcriptional regulator [Caldalkalibacillus mannanilyticus]|uniref:helix-turn-helix transcriptional regulator n=1 Tax=Caldalkalibacillus mannanilyticus TaxID=1418 RepID=UPI000AB2660E|nr:AraC family transcriptional regulator [Caldalkalibacillus mannanilyticus]
MKGEAIIEMVQPTWFYILKEIRYRVQPLDWKNEGNIRDGYTMWVITSGSGRIMMGDSSINLARGKCVMTTPNMEISMQSQSNQDNVSFYQLDFDVCKVNGTDLVKEMSKQSTPLPCQGEVLCHPFSQCLDFLEAIYQQRNSSDEMELFNIHVRFQELIQFIFQQNCSENSRASSIQQEIKNSIDYLKQQYDKPWTVDQLAELARVSRWQYTRMFKKVTGQVPLHYLNGIRIERAKQLLVKTDDRLMDIAQNIGFNNEYYFNRRFKQSVGISPGHYRKNHRESNRVFAPFLEDFLVALGITPVVQCFHNGWGKQDYLACTIFLYLMLKQKMWMDCCPISLIILS